MKILVISPHYHPRISPRSFRWTSITKELIKKGHIVDVVSSNVVSEKKQDTLNGVNVFRVGFGKASTLKNIGAESTSIRRSLINETYSIAKKIYNMTWKKIYWPDNTILNYPSYLRTIKKRIEVNGHYDYIIGVGLPFTSILVAYRASVMFNIPLLIDIGDPFSQSYLNNQEINNTKIYKALNYRVEKRIFNHAKSVFVTNEGIKSIYENEFKKKNIKILPPLFQASQNLNYSSRVLNKDNNKLNLVFIGTLHLKIRNPANFLKYVLDSPIKDEITLHFIGNINDCTDIIEKYSKKLNIELYGVFTKEKCDKAMLESDALINIGNNNFMQLPSKLADYIKSGKKILNYSFMKEDLSIDYLNGYPYVYNIIEKKEKNYKELYNFLYNNEINGSVLSNAIEYYRMKGSPKNLTNIIVDEIIS